MTEKLPPRRPSDPLALPRAALMPPAARSRAALGLAVMAAQGRFALQVCAACAAVQYPPRAVCHACLGAKLAWRDVDPMGTVLAETTVRISADPYVRPRTPWRTGLVALDAGPSVVAHLHGDTRAGARTRLSLMLDAAGQAAMVALPAEEMPHMADDPILREMTADPKGRRVLVTDGRNQFGQALARALEAAGAQVFLGIADPWKPFQGQDRLPGSQVPLDLTSEESVRVFAAEFGGRIDIVANTGLHIRPGDVLPRGNLTLAREEMEAAYYGPMRLAQALGPALRARAADGPYRACAWVAVHSIDALAPAPGYAATAPAQAAGLALAQSLRRELLPLRVLSAFLGPLEDEWHQAVPPPKVTPTQFATAIIRALRAGIEQLPIGDTATDLLARWHDNPGILARER